MIYGQLQMLFSLSQTEAAGYIKKNYKNLFFSLSVFVCINNCLYPHSAHMVTHAHPFVLVLYVEPLATDKRLV